MKKFLSLAIVVLALAAIAPVSALADGSGSTATVQADIAKLKTDVQTKHDTVVADAQKLEADAGSLVGTDKKTARETIKADALKLTGDWKSLLSVCLRDRMQLRADVKAARESGVPHRELRLLVREANLEIRLTNMDMRAAVLKARIAVIKLRQSFAAAGDEAPSVPTPPAQTPDAQPIAP